MLKSHSRCCLTTQRCWLPLGCVPFLFGGLGDYLEFCPRGDKFKNYVHINESLKHAASIRANTGFVSAEGLVPNPDYLHFSAPSLREFGLRYYEEFVKLEDKNKVFLEKSPAEVSVRTGLEHL